MCFVNLPSEFLDLECARYEAGAENCHSLFTSDASRSFSRLMSSIIEQHIRSASFGDHPVKLASDNGEDSRDVVSQCQALPL